LSKRTRPRVRLENFHVKGGEIVFEASFDESVARYLRATTLRFSYDVALESVDPCFVVIPFVSTILTVAWALGADVEVPVLDKTFIESAESIRKVMKSWYPRLSFRGEIRAHTTRSAAGTAGREGILYSGGLDSTASMLRHLDSRPVPMLVLGTPDLPTNHPEFLAMFLERVAPFVGQLGLKLHVIRSGMLEMVDLETLNEDFGKAVGGYWWESISHGLMLLGSCAPVAAAEGVGILRIAASRTEAFEEPWGSNPQVDEKLAWGGTRVVHDSYDLSRQQKIDSLIAPFLRGTKETIPLRACGSTKSKERVVRKMLNCERCEKCVRTIVGLLAGGVDPKACGFGMGYFSAESLRRGLEEGGLRLPKSVWDLWVDIQASVRKQRPEEFPSMYDARPFFEWMRGYDLSRNLYKPSLATRVLKDSVPRFSERQRSLELIREFRRMSAQAPAEQE